MQSPFKCCDFWSVNFPIDDGSNKVPVVNSAIDCFGILENLFHFLLIQGLSKGSHYLFQVTFAYVSALILIEKRKSLQQLLFMVYFGLGVWKLQPDLDESWNAKGALSIRVYVLLEPYNVFLARKQPGWSDEFGFINKGVQI